MLSTIGTIDALAKEVIPHHPPLKPHARMQHHFRFIAPLLQGEVLALWDSAIQMARLSEREMTEEEFVTGCEAAEEIRATSVAFLPPRIHRINFDYRLEETRQELIHANMNMFSNDSVTALESIEEL